MTTFDAIIIGSGQAGTPLAFRMADEGMKIAFIEKDLPGGTCVNFGCTPTKAYVASARRAWEARNADSLGIRIPDGITVDLSAVRQRKNDLIQKSRNGIQEGVNKNENIHYFHGKARFTGPSKVSVLDVEMTAPKIYINVGARAFIPEGFENLSWLDNRSILELESIPEHLIIVGGSYIGLEFGQMFRRFGSQVTIIERDSRIISREDPDVSDVIQEFMEGEGISFILNNRCIKGWDRKEGGVTVQIQGEKTEEEIHGSHALLATGRIPNTGDLGLDKAGISTDERGYIQVNDRLETSVPGIFALGDCNGKGAFTHTSYNDYEIVAENLFDGKDRKVSDRILCYALYVDPPLARAGLNRQELEKKGNPYLEACLPMSRVARAKEKGETLGFLRILVDPDTQQIHGASLLGSGADEIISGILNIMYAKQPYTIIRDSVQIHPTVAELIPTLLEEL